MWKLLMASLIAAPMVAAGQTPCREGQVRNEDTRGNCCWPGQAWSSSRNGCVGVPQCPPGYLVGQTDCTPQQSTVAPPPETNVAPADAPKLSNDQKLLKHLQLSQELADLNRQLEEKHWIGAYVVAGAVGGGLWALGAGLDVFLQAVVGGNAGVIAGFWTLVGCGIGGSITFVVMVIVGTVALVQSVVLRGRVNAKAEELQQYDAENHIDTSIRDGPVPAITVAAF